MPFAAFALSFVLAGSEPDWLDRYLAGSRALERRDHGAARGEFESALALLPRHAGTAYQLACAHAVAGDRDAALTWLAKAIDFGFTDVSVARWDADLASVRDDPRFDLLFTRSQPRAGHANTSPRFEVRIAPSESDTASDDTASLSTLGAHVWDGRTHERVVALERADERARSVAYSPGGRFAALSGTRGHQQREDFVRVHDAATGDAVCELPDAAASRATVDFSTDGRRLVVVGGELDHKRATVWDTATWTLVGTARLRHAHSVTSSPFANVLVIVEDAGPRSNVVVWNVATGAIVGRQDRCFSTTDVVARFSPDEALVAVHDPADPHVLVLDTSDGHVVKALFDLTRWVDTTFTRDGKSLWSATRDGTLALWDLATARITRRIETRERGVTAIELGVAAETLRLETHAGAVIFDVAAARVVDTQRRGTRATSVDLATARAGRVGDDVFWIGCADGSLRSVERATGRARNTLRASTSPIVCVGISTCGNRLAALDGDGVLHVVDADDGVELAHVDGLAGDVGDHHWREQTIEFGTDDTICVVRNRSGVVHVFDAASWQRVATVAPCDARCPSPFALSAAHALIATAEGPKQVALRSTRTGELLPTRMNVSGRVSSLAFEPSSSRLWIGTEDSSVEVFDVVTGMRVRTLEHGDLDWAGPTEIGSITFDARGTRAAIGTAGYGGIAAWDTATGRRLWQYAYEEGANPSALHSAFSRDGKELFVWGQMWSTGRVVETERGSTRLDLSDRDVLELVVAGDGLPAVAHTPLGTECVARDHSFVRFDCANDGWILQADSGHVDGSRAAFDDANARLVDGAPTLDALAAVFCDSKKVAARAAGVHVDPIGSIETPTLVWTKPRPRVVRLADDEEELELTVDAACSSGILAFEIVRDGVAERVAATALPGDTCRARWTTTIARPAPGTAVELRVCAIATTGVRSRPLRIAVEAAP